MAMVHPVGALRGAACLLAGGLSLLSPAVAASSGPEGPAFRSVPLTVPRAGKTGFTSLAPADTGVGFTNQLQGDLALTNAVAHNGSGVAVGDVDGDGLPDLYFCNLEGPNRLYRNLGGWRFAEQALAGADCGDQLSTGASFADVDGDGDLDLLVNGVAAGTRLFLNDGRGGLTEARDSGLSRTASATSLALADIDGDGDLDLYCTHYIDVMHLADPTTRFALAREGGRWRVTKVNGEPASRPYWKDRFEALPDGRVRELPEVHGLYRNEGGGRFRAIEFEPGVFRNAADDPIPPGRDWGLSVMFRDLNGDGVPDLYVCNDNASPDRVWINRGDGTFRAADPFVFRHTSRSSMALDFADVDRDGHDDLLVLDMLARDPARRMRQLVRDFPDPRLRERPEEQPRYNRNTLFLGRADGTFAEAALLAGVAATDWSWCPVFLDVDLDGYEDLLVSNGFQFDVMDQDSQDQTRRRKLTYEDQKRFRRFSPSWLTANAAFRNRGDGTFEPAPPAWGFDQPGISYGMAVGDLDRDGDLDVVVNNLNAAASLYRNDSTAGRIAVRLRGRPPNTQGTGARVRLVGGAVTQSQDILCGGRYLSGDEALRVFAADCGSTQALHLEVRWRDGTEARLPVEPNQAYEVSQSAAAPRPPPAGAPADAGAWFTDASSLLNHAHAEEEFDDWSRQPLLPRRLSRLGPGLGWYDLDGDGWEDLILTAAGGGAPAGFLNEQGRGFRPLPAAPVTTADQGAVVGFADGQGRRRLLLAESGFEAGPGQASALTDRVLAGPAASLALAPTARMEVGPASPGPLALGDLDGDGDLDLFVGGRFLPGRYPEPVASAVWINAEGELRPDPAWSAPFASVGLVSGATLCDLDADGDPDLALAMDWGPVRLYLNDRGRLVDQTTAWGLGGRTGCWMSVTAGDFDGDGRLDLAAGNWGRNTEYELGSPGPWRLWYGDANADGILEVIESWWQGDQWLPVRNRNWLARGLADLPQRYPTHEAYGRAPVAALLAGRPETWRFVEAAQFESGVFLNRGTNFGFVPFPRDAQLTPVFGLSPGDFDGDGIEDLFLAQNFFGSASDLTREDSGRGWWLRGRGDGTFRAAETGIRVHGEQRAAALADFNHDSRVDVAVTQNDGPTRLYVNQQARPGLRVVLTGPATNPDAIGAQLRIQYAAGHAGPVRAVQAGSGYWSQDAATQVLALGERPTALRVRWPGGREETVPLVAGQPELRVRFEHESE